MRMGINPLQKQKVAYIIDDIGQTDPHGGSSGAYGSDNEPRLRSDQQRYVQHVIG
ncbi:hypothetical protein AA0473_0245 [Acetobacter orleanensis NRIC 0473]|uniref:Uncharacterized protein n=1 Tax=Acetobacter orleanensis TaxID=104099 RepID=A0A4Y3TNX4_9PROT|nr:hypothetical protein Abol_019_002 [Acetobacter orleanensis JCM 7639]GBR22891.1 hypothetical protein AA0473_0245 [Acetobacter orleanensis NRIC 0473]GEB82670.1 hypothetical protein AOR01nite_11470 [Acetobacter orleanensis]